MEDPNDAILNEFLERIKEIEQKNDLLRENIKKKKEEIIKFDKEKEIPKKEEKKEEKKDEVTINKKLPTDEEEEIEAKKAFHNYQSIKFNRIEIEKNAIEYIIEYTTQEQYSSLYIMGDFTKWALTKMEKTKDKFIYKVILLKGFKYYYSFQAGAEIIIDYNNIYEENPITFQIQNCIDLTQNNKDITFNCEKDMKILEIAQKNYFLSNIDINEDEFIFLTKLKNRGELIKQIYGENRNKYNKIVSSINLYYDELNKNVGMYNINNIAYKLRGKFINKILVQNHFDDKKNYNILYYRIKDLSENYIFLCEKLYDNNHIKINRDYYTHNAFYNSINPNQISFLPLNPESNLFHLLSFAESQKILEEYNKDNNNIIKAYFKTLFNLKNPVTNNIVNNNLQYVDFYLNRNIFLVKPRKVEPERINLDDYDFYYSYNRITKVKNKNEQIDVKFIAIDESLEKNKRPNRLEIFYGIKNNKMILIHCHVLDKDLRNSKMVIKEINKGTDTHILKKSEEYIKNNELLLLVQESIPIKLYYKGKKVKANMVRIEENKIYILNTLNMDNIYNKMYVKVTNFENKLNYDLIEQCNEFSYSFDNIQNIQNGVDVQVIFDNQKNYVTEPMMFSVTPCLLKSLSFYEENALKKKLPNNFNENDKIKKYFDIKQKFEDLKKNNGNKIDQMNQEERDKLIMELDEYSKSMEEILEYFEMNEIWDNYDEAANISSNIIDYIDYIDSFGYK